jgi:group I intron endonuclease
MKIGGVYKIVNGVNGKFYIGSSNNVRNRWQTHRTRLKSNSHENIHLQSAVNQYGIENFSLVLERELPSSNPDLILEEEQKLLDKWVGTESCYNLNDRVDKLYGIHNPMYGKHHSHTTLEVMSRHRKGKLRFDEHPMFNPTIYTFRNTENGEVFVGTCHDFCEKYRLNKGNVVQLLRRGKRVQSVKHWILL